MRTSASGWTPARTLDESAHSDSLFGAFSRLATAHRTEQCDCRKQRSHLHAYCPFTGTFCFAQSVRSEKSHSPGSVTHTVRIYRIGQVDLGSGVEASNV